MLYASAHLENLLKVNKNLSEEEIAGVRIIQNAIKIPLITICQNAGFEGSLIAAKLLEEGNNEKGFNAANGQYVNLK